MHRYVLCSNMEFHISVMFDCFSIFLITRRMPVMMQVLLTIPEHMSSSPVFSEVFLGEGR